MVISILLFKFASSLQRALSYAMSLLLVRQSALLWRLRKPKAFKQSLCDSYISLLISFLIVFALRADSYEYENALHSDEVQSTS